MKKFLIKNWAYLISGLLIVSLYSLRFYHLTILPVFADEAIYIRWAQVMKAEETLRFLPLSDGKQPLFMWVIIPFLKLISDPLTAGRLVSVFSGLGTLIGVTCLSYLLFKKIKAALAAGFIYALTPFTFFFDRLSLADSTLTMFGVWTFIFSYLAITKKRLDFAMLSGFSLGGAWLTKSPALFFALMFPALLIFSEKKKILYSIFYILTSTVIGYGFYNILRLGPNYSMIARRNMDYVYPLTHLFSSPFDPLKPWLLQSWQWLVMMGPWSLLIILVMGYLLNYKNYWKQIFVLSFWFLVPIFIESEYAKVLTARYILFALPYLPVIASSIFLAEKKNWIKLSVFALSFFAAQSLIFDYKLLTNPQKANLPRSERSGYLEEWTAGQGIKETADYLIKEQNTHPADKIVIGTEGYFGTLPDGLMAYLNNDKRITIIGVGLDFDKVPVPLTESKKSGNRTFLLINDDRFKGNPAKENLRLIKSYPKALRPDGSYQSLLFFELI